MTKHRCHSAAFKRQVAEEFIAGETLHGLSKRHDISRQLIRIWVSKFESGALDDDVQAADLIQKYEASRVLEGRPLEGLRKPWDRAKRAAGLPADLRIHDLRHSLASALANAGTPLYEIGALLGHRQLSTTTRYAHHSQQRMVETATAAARAWNLLPAPEAGGDR